MNATLPTARQTRPATTSRKPAPATHVQDLLREIVIAMHATRPVKKLSAKA